MELSASGYGAAISSNILEFLKALPVCAKEKGITFSTPTEIATKLKSVDMVMYLIRCHGQMKNAISVRGWVM